MPNEEESQGHSRPQTAVVFMAGDLVERIIDGMSFLAVIDRITRPQGNSTIGGLASLTYLDDGNREADVPIDELQAVELSENSELVTRVQSTILASAAARPVSAVPMSRPGTSAGRWGSSTAESKINDTDIINDCKDYQSQEQLVAHLLQRPLTAGPSHDSRVETLPRPLAGLVEDDYASRNATQPNVYRHTENDGSYTTTSSSRRGGGSSNESRRRDVVETGDGAILMNGAENRLAVGAGLRALRYLKN